MYLIKRPDAQQIETFITAQSCLDFTYPRIGATRVEEFPTGYRVDHNRIRLGTGKDLYEAAKRALCDWQHYCFEWLMLYRPNHPPEPEQTVAALAHALELWVLNACRVVYVIEETEPLLRFAFAYGTLPEHAESGEERFQVEWHEEDDSVWYDIFAFSRPNQVLSRLAYPYVRHKQKQFARESMLSMQAAVAVAAAGH